MDELCTRHDSALSHCVHVRHISFTPPAISRANQASLSHVFYICCHIFCSVFSHFHDKLVFHIPHPGNLCDGSGSARLPHVCVLLLLRPLLCLLLLLLILLLLLPSLMPLLLLLLFLLCSPLSPCSVSPKILWFQNGTKNNQKQTTQLTEKHVFISWVW